MVTKLVVCADYIGQLWVRGKFTNHQTYESEIRQTEIIETMQSIAQLVKILK